MLPETQKSPNQLGVFPSFPAKIHSLPVAMPPESPLHFYETGVAFHNTPHHSRIAHVFFEPVSRFV